jgi:ADP-ribose pyrophosphatase YjhB (NUDIX family)
MPREYPEYPIPSVGVVVVRDHQALLIRRGNEPARGRWSIPGGVIETGELLHDAARRELREECGIEIEVGPMLQIFESVTRDPEGRVRFHYIILDLLGRHASGEVTPGGDVLDASYVSADELDALDVLPDAAKLVREVLARE